MEKLNSIPSFFCRSAVILLFLLFFLSFWSSLVMASSPNTVTVNAKIQQAQVIGINGDSLTNTRKQARMPINLEDPTQITNDKIVISDTLHITVGSNTEWALSAKVADFDETRKFVEARGWKVEKVLITHEGNEVNLTGSPKETTSGENGSFNLELSFKLVIQKISTSTKKSLSLDDLENHLVFAIK